MEIDMSFAQFITTAIAVLGLVIEHFHYQASLENRITKIETKIDLFWRAVEERFSGMLLKGNPIELDSELGQLLIKHKEKNTNNGDIHRLIQLLDEEIVSKRHTPTEEVAMVLMSTALRVRLS